MPHATSNRLTAWAAGGLAAPLLFLSGASLAAPQPPSRPDLDAPSAVVTDEPAAEQPPADEPPADEPPANEPAPDETPAASEDVPGTEAGDATVPESGELPARPLGDGWTTLIDGPALDGWAASPPGAWAAAGDAVFVAAPDGNEDDVETRRAELAWTGEPLPEHYELSFHFACTPAAIPKVRIGGKGPDQGFVFVGFPDPNRSPDWWAVVSSYQPGRAVGYRRFNLTRSAAAVRAARYVANENGGTAWNRVRVRVVSGAVSLTVNGVDLGGGKDADLTNWTRTPHLIVDRKTDAPGPAWVRFRSVRVRPLTADGDAAEGAAGPP